MFILSTYDLIHDGAETSHKEFCQSMSISVCSTSAVTSPCFTFLLAKSFMALAKRLRGFNTPRLSPGRLAYAN